MKNQNQLTHLVSIDTLPSSGFKLELKPTDAESALLAQQLNIVSIQAFNAELIFKRWRKDGISVRGRIFAKLVQECVVTLEPLVEEFTEEFERTFLPEGSKLAKPRLNNEGEMIIDPEGDDVPDLFVGKNLDAWDIVVEQTQLAMDPFPRAQGVDISNYAPNDDDLVEEKQSPFAALEALKKSK